MRSLLVLPLLLLCACSKPTPRAPSARWLEVFPAYPGAAANCTENVLGVDMEIAWTMYVSRDDPEKVRAFYREHAGAAEVSGEGDELLLRGPDDKTLSVHSVGGSYPKCDQEPPSGTKTVVIVARAYRR